MVLRLNWTLRSIFRLVQKIINNSDLGRPSKWLPYRFGWKNYFMYDDTCPVAPALVICLI